ncbi:MAG: HAMP domain-containing histidine kinase [Actinobacteria bacterium]|nr:HAMP domain-containing histidine kinase [Actinomycetota bacterium]
MQAMKSNAARRFVGMRWWLGFAFAGVAAVTAVAVVAVFNFHADAALQRNADVYAAGATTLAADELRGDGLGALRAQLPRIASRRHIALFVFDQGGRLLTPPRSHGVTWSRVPSGRVAVSAALAHRRYVRGSDEGVVAATRIERGEHGPVLVGYAFRPELAAQLGLVHHEFWVATLVALALGGALGITTAVLISRRLARLARAARAIGEGDLRTAVSSRFPDEVGSLADSINEMKTSLDHAFRTLERQEQAQREFAANAAHEFRTPLASIVTAVEMLQTGAKDDPEARDAFLDVVEREAGRLSRLIRALLVLARAQAHEERPRTGPIDVAGVLRRTAASFSPAPGVELQVDCAARLTVTGDSDLLEQAVTSIVANAVKHTHAGSITLYGCEDDGRVVVEVRDTGSGIAPHERRRIFDRFYTAGTERDGFGLGLPIAQAAVTALGGEMQLESAEGEGTTITLTFEASRQPVLA